VPISGNLLSRRSLYLILRPDGEALTREFPLKYSAVWTVNLLSAVHQLAWTQYPAIWLCESCAILWLVVRAVRSPWVQAGVLLILCGLMLNALVTETNGGTMPVVGMPSTLHSASPMWQAATPKTRLPFLADQARLGLFSVGDLVMIFGGILIVTNCLHRTLKMEGSLNCKRLKWVLRDKTRDITRPGKLSLGCPHTYLTTSNKHGAPLSRTYDGVSACRRT